MLTKSEFSVYVLDNPFIPETHRPTIKQAEFLIHDELEGLYGGAGGGGKTDALLMASLMYAEVPGYSALLLRRTYKDLALPEAILDRAKEWLIGKAKWDEEKKLFTFPSGAKLTFGHLEHENAKYMYQGARFDFVGFDEISQFPLSQYQYLFSRIRRAKGVDIPPRCRTASNPGGVGHEWVKDRFITNPEPGVFFIPATMFDNPYLDHNAYLESLSRLDPVTRAQMERGDWDIALQGNYFKREYFEIVDDYPHEARLVRAWDLAATEKTSDNDPDWTAGILIAERDGLYYVVDVQHTRSSPGDVEDLVYQMAQLDPYGTKIVMEQEPGSAGVSIIQHYARNILKGFAFKGIKVSGAKEVRAQPVSAAASNGNIKLVRGYWNNEFLNELSMFPTKGVHDDCVDSLSLGFFEISRPQNIVAVNLKALHKGSGSIEAQDLKQFMKSFK